MAIALELALKAKGSTFPNPAVGAVVVKGGVVVGKGATSAYGGPHAEKVALKQAGGRAENATMYVTLEPCDHFGKTPPCTDAIIGAGIKRVYVATADPNPLVSGRGVRRLKKNGVNVFMGLMREQAQALNEDFFWSITRQRPWVSLKLAMTFDGRIADETGHSKWITSAASRTFAHELRRRHAAVVIGGATLRSDDPWLTVRHVAGTNPVRIVFSKGSRLPAASYFMKHTSSGRSIAVTGGGKKPEKNKGTGGLEIWRTGQKSLKKCIHTFLDMAYEEGLTSILVEGGQRMASAFMESGRVNRIYLMYGNKLLGRGLAGFSFSSGLPLANAIELQSPQVTRFGDDIMVTGVPNWKKVP